MMITKKQQEELVNNSLQLDFVEIKLTGPKSKGLFTYAGSGTISQDADGNLALKMYYKYESEKEMTEDTKAIFKQENVIPGTLIGQDHFSSLEGRDFDGNIWTADNFRTNNHVSYVASGRIIEANLHSIKNVSERFSAREDSTSRFNALIPGEFSIPCNSIEKTDDGSRLNTCKLSFDGMESSIIKRKNYVELNCHIDSNANHENTYKLFSEAFGVSIGNFFQPICLSSSTREKHEIVISSRKSNDRDRPIAPPVPSGHHQTQFLHDFISHYMAAFEKPNSVFFIYWWRVFNAFFEWVENRALITATSVEGVLKKYFKQEGMPDGDYLSQVKDALPKINSLDIGQRVKARMLSSLGQSQSPTPKNMLYALQRKNLITDEIIKSYLSLRNQVSHPTAKEYGVDEFQSLLDKTYSCLYLFYELLFIHIGYKGDKIDYSKRGWPTSGAVSV